MKTIVIEIDGHKCTCSKDNIHIENSYQIPNNKVRLFLVKLLRALRYQIRYKRTIDSWEKEWIAHNRLYKLGLYRDHTKDVDLNEDESKKRLIVYNILSI